jgi:hypothetical protein
MRVSKRAMITAGSFLLAGALGSVLFPHAAHGIVAALVQVTNTSANPVPTQAVDNPAREAVFLVSQENIPDGQFSVVTGTFNNVSGPYTVPAGQRLVVDSISGYYELPTGQQPTFPGFVVSVNGLSTYVLQVPVLVQSAGGRDRYQFATQLTTYADPGTAITPVCNRYPYSAGEANCYAALSGHLVNIQ